MSARVQLGSAHTWVSGWPVAPENVSVTHDARIFLTPLRTPRVNVCVHCATFTSNPVPVHDPCGFGEQIFIHARPDRGWEVLSQISWNISNILYIQIFYSFYSPPRIRGQGSHLVIFLLNSRSWEFPPQFRRFYSNISKLKTKDKQR